VTTTQRHPVAAAQVTAGVQALAAALADAVDLDWHVRAGDLDWDCWSTAVHVASDLISYAGQVVGQPERDYIAFDITVSPETEPRELLSVITTCGGLLASAVATARPEARGWHPYGTSDPEGFAAMGLTETLVHTFDITQGLGLDWMPPAGLATAALGRLFPDAPDGDPAAGLLWCTGRVALPDLPRRASWRWDSTVRQQLG
jgi:hypothetical protein